MYWLGCLSLALADGALESDDSLLWGPYRPNLYFGMRPRIPESFMSGLMWYETKTPVGISALRHDCLQTDAVDKFSWTAFDSRLGGQEVIVDGQNRVNLTTDLVKSEDGRAWEVRVRGEQAQDNVLTLVWYSGLESAESEASEANPDFLQLSRKSQSNLSFNGLSGPVELIGSSEKLGGPFRVTVSEGTGRRPQHTHEYASVKPAELSHYASLQLPPHLMWRAQNVFTTLIEDQMRRFVEIYGQEDLSVPLWSVFSLPDTDSLGGNLHYVQKTFSGPFEFSVRFEPSNHGNWAKTPFEERFTEVLRQQDQRFTAGFDLQPPYDKSESYRKFANEMISSIAGGVGYFYGDSLIQSEDDLVTKGPTRGLFTGTPSRAFFPRGFYWDEGLNALALMKYDRDLVLQIILSWFATMDEDGWIEREQILGDEGRSRVPAEFQVQNPNIANPPTLVMALAHLGTAEGDAKIVEQLERLYPALQKHFKWFRTTQSGEVTLLDREYPSHEVYRWRGRTPTHILASGLDDYPRAPEPSDGELHVDLLAWVGAMARSLAQVAQIVGKPEDEAKYLSIIDKVQQNLESVHWSESDQAFCDITLDEFEEDVHVCHIGYVTHLPFMLKLVPETSNAKLLAIIRQLADPRQLMSPGGVRSLSRRDPFFGLDENYWRGASWNNMNFLTLDALQHYARPEAQTSQKVKQQAADLYKTLRQTVVDNIYSEWKRTGYVWESYDGVSGEAKGAKAFTGWAGLVANIMAMPDSLEIAVVHDEI